MTTARRPPIRFDQIKEGHFERTPGFLRLSTGARLLREQGNDAGAAELERDAAAVAPWCLLCERKLTDPVVGIAGDRVAFACPWRSGPEVLKQWEAEGASAPTNTA